jgi:hypothetical protein
VRVELMMARGGVGWGDEAGGTRAAGGVLAQMPPKLPAPAEDHSSNEELTCHERDRGYRLQNNHESVFMRLSSLFRSRLGWLKYFDG